MSKKALAMFTIALAVGGARSASGLACPGTITADFEANEDISAGAGNCITTATSGVTINLKGHAMVCNNAGGCGNALTVSNNTSNVLIKNAIIKAGSGHWSGAVNNGVTGTGGNANTTTVKQISVYDGTLGVLNPWTVVGSVFRIAGVCMFNFYSVASGGLITKNYCHTNGGSDNGLLIGGGTTSATTATVERNFVRISNPTGYGIFTSGYVKVQHNVVIGSIPSVTNATYRENICDTPAVCPEPDSNFALSLDFDVTPLGM